MSDDLVKRLRSTTTINPDVKLEPPLIQKQAADRIEELEAKLRWALDERDATFALMLKRAETAEAKLAIYEAALKHIAQHDTQMRAIKALSDAKGDEDE